MLGVKWRFGKFRYLHTNMLNSDHKRHFLDVYIMRTDTTFLLIAFSRYKYRGKWRKAVFFSHLSNYTHLSNYPHPSNLAQHKRFQLIAFIQFHIDRWQDKKVPREDSNFECFSMEVKSPLQTCWLLRTAEKHVMFSDIKMQLLYQLSADSSAIFSLIF